MTRKAAAKRSEANAAVRRRSAGLDQRFKMSASVAGFPSINAATACLSFFCSLSSARCGEHLYSVLQLLQTLIDASPISARLYEMRAVFCTSSAPRFASYTAFEPLQQARQLASVRH